MTDLDFQNLSEKLNLPLWFLERVAIEYLDVRALTAITDIDLTRPAAQQLEEVLSNQPIVVVGSTVLANIHPDTYRTRVIASLAGRPNVPVTDQLALLEPEGKIPAHSFPSMDNGYDVVDPKLNFYSHFQVLDEGQLWQWKIAEFLTVDNRNYGMWVSDVIDLLPLDEITPRFRDLDSKRQEGEGRPSAGEISEFFDWVESIRAPIRAQLCALHMDRKSVLNVAGRETTLPPPLLSAFEAFSLQNGQMRTRFHAEPLFFRAAVRHARKAAELEATSGAFLDEIYSERIEAVINAAACLEAFVNSLGERKLPLWSKLHEKNTPIEKWRICVLRTGNNDVYVSGVEPYQTFERIVKLRNDFMHHKPEEHAVVQGGNGPMTYIQKHMPPAFIESLPSRIRELITILCEKTKEPTPGWLEPKPGWDV
ncbi:hypothetical protein [Paraburkholderia tropica]|uniref:hypothetical protein n=1 Tax=Paraburkholderia tropica TaxID=92647 RepID=UPI00161936F9|nr:hypothetical protein [Paraburkholderia tropica]MBB2984463.1 hypothetical protein [Paraburkholderia tropica]